MNSMHTKTIAAIVDFANIFLGRDTSLSTYCHNSVRLCSIINIILWRGRLDWTYLAYIKGLFITTISVNNEKNCIRVASSIMLRVSEGRLCVEVWCHIASC